MFFTCFSNACQLEWYDVRTAQLLPVFGSVMRLFFVRLVVYISFRDVRCELVQSSLVAEHQLELQENIVRLALPVARDWHKLRAIVSTFLNVAILVA